MPEHDALTDQQLIAAANAGDAEAFEALYRRYRDWVVALAHRFTGNRDDALDVMQDTFTYLLGKFPGFVLTSQLKTFLYSAVRNLSIRRRQKASRTVSADGLLDELPALSPGPVDDRADDDLATVLATLPVAQRQVLLMRFVDGLALAEIALALSIPVGTVKSRMHNALNTLRADPRTNEFFAP